MKRLKNCVVIGGGLAGLISSIHLILKGHDVILIEKKRYPFHKVCGEFISNEVKPFLNRLQLSIEELNAMDIDQFRISSENGKRAECKMELGGFGISRYTLDNFLYEKAKQNGVLFKHDTVVGIDFRNEQFSIRLKSGDIMEADLVIGAFGKRSVLDKQLDRDFFKERTSYMGVKWHMKADFPAHTVALHHFTGGYAGLSRVEDGKVNFCYLTTDQVFKQYGDIDHMQEKHLAQNPFLAEFLNNSEPLFEKPLVISQVNFSSKPAVENHVLMCGDAAGLIHPLCGNGMAMAIHGAKIAAEESDLFLSGRNTREQMERHYHKRWHHVFDARLRFGRYAQGLLENQYLFPQALNLAIRSPYLLKKTVGLSHGRPFL